MKTAAHIRLGKNGELQARDYLIEKGYTILHTNWVYEKAEIDIVAEKSGEVIFAEVKTRRNMLYGFPEEAVTPRKQKLLQRAAEAYVFENNLNCSVRFDIISIVQFPSEILHLEDAFFPFDSI